MKTIILILIAFLFTACASAPFKQIDHNIPLDNIKEINNPISEKIFCLKDDGSIYDLKYGILFICPFMPNCEPGDIMTHTHPIYCEDRANFSDKFSFTDYNKKYGVSRFGVFWHDKLTVYEIRGNDG